MSTTKQPDARPEGVAPPSQPQQPGAGGGRMAAVDRRLQIAQTAMRLFSERGFRGTTTKEIAQAAGVSEAIIFRHFATKEDLYSAIIDLKSCDGFAAGIAASAGAHDSNCPQVIEKVRGRVAEAMRARDDRAVFEGLALAMMEHHQSDHDMLRLLLYSALEGHQLAQIFWDKNVRVLYEFLGGYVRERQREGAFRGADPLLVVRAFTGAVIHHSLNNILWERDPARRIINVPNEHAAREFTEILLRGVLTETGAREPSLRKNDPSKRAAAREVIKGRKGRGGSAAANNRNKKK
ncbi:MAG TPA: helix-turn-helix domain-containing protein [Pyrinomonadaceae bacterium]|jgi:AcrR family transcriptional regulator|nr:helix-turn-helix domain-containing protein [Pyrinomonadaceae bacterium]